MKQILLLVVLLAATVAAGLPGLGDRDFWPPDEARYGEVTRELAEGTHHPLVPYLNGEVYPDKPPGFFLAGWGASLLTGRADEAAVRLPSLVGGAILVALTGLWVARAAGSGAGILSGLLLLASVLFGFQMRQAQLDMFFAAWIGLMMACWYRAWTTGHRRWNVLAFVFLFLAVFVKGPLSLIGLLVAVLWSLATRRPRAFFNLGTLGGLLVFLVLTGGWLFWAWRVQEASGPGLGSDYLQATVGRHVVERATEGLAHVKEWYAYFVRLPINLLPFVPLLLLLLLPAVREAIMGPALPLARFAALWLLVFLAIQSSFPGKREIYLLPLYPAAAILLGLTADAAARALPHPVRVWSGIVALLVLTAALAALWCSKSAGHADRLLGIADGLTGGAASGAVSDRAIDFGSEPLRDDLALWAALVGPAALAGFVLSWVPAPRAALAWSALAAALAVGLGCGLVLPHLDPGISRREVAAKLDVLSREAGKPGPVGMFYHLDEGLPFYLRRPLPEIGGEDRKTMRRPDPSKGAERDQARQALAAFLAQPGAVAVVRRKDAERFGLKDGEDFAIRDRHPLGDREFLLVGAVR